jgi:hypothetical protein
MTATMTERKSTPLLDLDVRASDLIARREQLREQQARIAPEAVSDDRAAQEEADVVSQIVAVDRELDRIALARTEIDRREQEAQRQAKEKAIAAAARRAAKSQERVRPSREAIDSTALAYAKALASDCELSQQLARDLRAADDPDPRVGLEPRQVQSGLLYALGAAGVPHGLLDIPRLMQGHPEPVVPPAED